MKSSETLSPAAQVAVAALVVLGLLGGCLIVAHSGFATSPKRGGPSTFVPAPAAYILAVAMVGMSGLGLLALLRNWHATVRACAAAAVLYAVSAAVLVALLVPD